MPLPYAAEIREARREANLAAQAYNDRELAERLIAGLRQIPSDFRVDDLPGFPAWELLNTAVTRWGHGSPLGGHEGLPAAVARLEALAAFLEARGSGAEAAVARMQALQRLQIEACYADEWTAPAAELARKEAIRRTLVVRLGELEAALKLDRAVLAGFTGVIESWENAAPYTSDVDWRGIITDMANSFSGALVDSEVAIDLPGAHANLADWKAYLAQVARREPAEASAAAALKAEHDALYADLLSEMG